MSENSSNNATVGKSEPYLRNLRTAIIHGASRPSVPQAVITDLWAHVDDRKRAYVLLYLKEVREDSRQRLKIASNCDKSNWDTTNADMVARIDINTPARRRQLFDLIIDNDDIPRLSLTPLVDSQVGVVQDESSGDIIGIYPPIKPNKVRLGPCIKSDSILRGTHYFGLCVL